MALLLSACTTTEAPTVEPTEAPTAEPTEAPTAEPTTVPVALAVHATRPIRNVPLRAALRLVEGKRHPLDTPASEPWPEITTLTVLGDIMLARRVGQRIRAEDDPAYPLRPIANHRVDRRDPAATRTRAGTDRLDMPPRTGPLDRAALPHWVQGWEKFGSVTVVHALGNFVFDMDFSRQTQEGVFVEVVLWGGQVKAVEPVPYVIGADFAAPLAGSDRAREILADVASTSRGPYRRP